MKRFPLCLFGLILFYSCFNEQQNSSNVALRDSTDFYLQRANNFELSIEDRISSNHKALKLTENSKNDSTGRRNLFKIANRYFNMNQYVDYKGVAELLVNRSSNANDSVSLASAYNYLGDYYTNTPRKDSAFHFYRKAEKLYKKLGDNRNLGQVYINISLVKSFEKDYYGSELSAIQSLNVLRDIKDKEKMYEAYNILGFISFELKDYQKSIEYHKKALQLGVESDGKNIYHLIATSLNNLGNVYQTQEQHDKALEVFYRALEDKNLFRDKPVLYSTLYDNIAYSKFKLGRKDDLPGLFYKSLKIRDSINARSGVLYSKLHLSEYFLSEQDTAKAVQYANEALEISRETKVNQDILSALKNLGTVDKKNAAKYSVEYIRINDSLQQAERKAKEKFARIEFETDEILLKNDRLTEQNRTILYVFIVVILIGLLLFVIKSQRTRTRELVLKQAQQKANEEIYNLMLYQQNKIEEGRINEKQRIAQELHDGILGRLFGARLNLDSLNRRPDDEAVGSRKHYLEELKTIEQDIREISHDLSREKFALNNNFVGIVNNLLEQQENLSDAKISYSSEIGIVWDKVDNTIKINLYRVLQEALQNINKYAKANQIIVDFRQENETILLTISDDGIGFSTDKKNKGIGLQNMVSRAESCGGNVDIQSSSSHGTTIIFSVPISSNPKTA